MQYNRRNFIKLTGGLTTGLALGSLTGASLLSSCNNNSAKGIKEFGLQLYTLRDEMPKDPKGVLKQVASFGYDYIESYSGANGIFWGMPAADFKKYLDEIGLKMYSAHCNVDNEFEKLAADAASIGMKYLIYPYEGDNQTMDDYKRHADVFNQKGEICKKNGLRFAFHNHDFSFLPINGEFPQDLLAKNTDPELVDFQMDVYWVVTANQDPVAWAKKNEGRFKLCHVKDRIKNTADREGTCTLGEGSIRYPEILPQLNNLGVDYFVVEQERYDGTSPLKAAEADAAYMKKLIG
ncbi:MAG: sugar phosphate isomerase/epimerase [Chitinophagaceae bacterium]|nr:sugar phosphate isomerase/epimerase [Chitinophagaceae bacterium]